MRSSNGRRRQMSRPPLNTQMFALRDVSSTLSVAGDEYSLLRVFKHDFYAATCLYQAVSPARFPRIVVKFGRRQMFCGLPLAWLGRWNRRHEEAIYRVLSGVEGVPRWLGRCRDGGYAIEYIDAKPLDHLEAPPPGFFDRLREIFDAIHARGVAYCDANKRSNILVDPSGRPFLVDFQLAIHRRDDLPWPLRAIVGACVRYLAGKDLYHLYKHKRRLAPQELTEQEEALSRHRSFLHRLHRKFTKPYRFLRRDFLRKRYEQGKLVSPTAKLEDHHQPEKATWRKDRTGSS